MSASANKYSACRIFFSQRLSRIYTVIAPLFMRWLSVGMLLSWRVPQTCKLVTGLFPCGFAERSENVDKQHLRIDTFLFLRVSQTYRLAVRLFTIWFADQVGIVSAYGKGRQRRAKAGKGRQNVPADADRYQPMLGTHTLFRWRMSSLWILLIQRMWQTSVHPTG